MTFIPKEVPIGAIDGVNKQFQLANNASQIDDVFFDGAIYLATITHTPGSNIIILEDAPTVSLKVDYDTYTEDVFSTLSTLLSQLRAELKIDPNDKIWSKSTKESYLNRAYLKVQRDGQFNWRENQEEDNTSIQLSTGVEKYSLPSDFIRLDYMQLQDNNFILRASNLAKIRTRGNSGNSTPNEYYIYGNQVGFYPIPDKSYTILLLYRKRLPTLTDSQDSELPNDFDIAIVKYAAYLAWSAPRGNAQVAAQKLADYEEAMKTLRLSYLMQDSANLKFAYQREVVTNRSDKAIYD